ncbi:hypothetical protein BC939DRAFT_447169 [Gamsiella multidivaricata]|uniref:uncharacterized protein n=1 Tax=Gamsiella multidivaricata TaxID=101098 RepID=UPI00221EB6C0|nr:uncharacterized protein BC939DRAFT_447169 [Gamsiella multidivaricata]KAG0366242.1 hypothetical protein BGZ54_005613 [Gamsiella multidivaricata]KAI7826180.1 hypothetical protein BC939DRAFT_447169 [Gamsiella multidivaricata]
MKLLLRLSLATLLVSTAFSALTLEQFLNDPQVKTLAPHLLDEITAQGIESFSSAPQDSSKLTAGSKIPLLDDIIQVVSLNIASGKDADWSKLDAAKLKAIQEHGPEALAAAANLTEIDPKRASIIARTIYDAVINLPPPSKESYEAKKSVSEKIAEAKDTTSTNNEQTPNTGKTDNKQPDNQQTEEAEKKDDNADGSSSLLDMLGYGLIKSSDTIKKVKAIVVPSNVCETTNTAYLKGVDDVVYYGSLSQGITGGALVSAPSDSTVKSLDLKTIVSAVSKLATELQMAQSVARLAELNPTDRAVRTIVYLALTAESSTAPAAVNARDINNLIYKGLANDIPEALLDSLASQAALVLVTRGVGSAHGGGAQMLSNIPRVRNLFAFSSEVLSANSIGEVLKYVFCPEASHVTGTSKTKVVTDDIKEGAGDAAKKGTETAQKVFKAGEEAAEDVKNKAWNTKDKVQDKVVEGTEKVNAAGERVAQDVKGATAEAKVKATEAQGAAKTKAEEVAEAARRKKGEAKNAAEIKAQQMKDGARDAAKKVADQVEKKAEKVAQKADEVKQEL